MRTRLLLGLIGLALTCLSIGATAQTPGKVYRVGFVGIGSGPSYAATLDGFGRSLARHGYSVGVNLLIESRFADAKPERLPALVKELLDSSVDVIVTMSYPAARAAKDGTSTVPIVSMGAGDPVETGLAASLSRPGGNITGMSDLASELSAKRLELLKIAVPGLKRVAMLWNADDLGMTARYRAAAAAAVALGVSVQPLGVREPDDFEAAFAAMTRDKPDGILMVSDILTSLNRKRVFEFAAAHRVPAIYELESFARDGGLMAYGPDLSEMRERGAGLVDRVLKGAKPADLPYEQPTRFQFVINQTTANTLGLAMPEELLRRADEVIE